MIQREIVIPQEHPAELIAAVMSMAKDDADAVIECLKLMGIPSGTLLPAGFLLGLAAILRVIVWEDQGILIHLESGLPDARQLLRDLFTPVFRNAIDDLIRFGFGVWYWVLELRTTRMAWGGANMIGADVLVGEVNEEIFVETLAQFLWVHRHGENK